MHVPNARSSSGVWGCSSANNGRCVVEQRQQQGQGLRRELHRHPRIAARSRCAVAIRFRQAGLSTVMT